MGILRSQPSRALSRFVFELTAFVLLSSPAAVRSSQDESHADSETSGVSEASPQLHIVWFYPGSLVVSFDLVKAETDRLFREIAVPTVWDRGNSVVCRPDAVDIIVVLIDRFHCIAGVNDEIIGFTYRSPRGRKDSRHTITIYLPNVLRTLGFELRPDRPSIPLQVKSKLKRPKATYRLARALGRIVAHEIVHVVSPPIPHTTHGLMARVYRWGTLTDPDMHFPPQYADLFRANLATAVAAKMNTLFYATKHNR